MDHVDNKRPSRGGDGSSALMVGHPQQSASLFGQRYGGFGDYLRFVCQTVVCSIGLVDHVVRFGLPVAALLHGALAFAALPEYRLELPASLGHEPSSVDAPHPGPVLSAFHFF